VNPSKTQKTRKKKKIIAYYYSLFVKLKNKFYNIKADKRKTRCKKKWAINSNPCIRQSPKQKKNTKKMYMLSAPQAGNIYFLFLTWNE